MFSAGRDTAEHFQTGKNDMKPRELKRARRSDPTRAVKRIMVGVIVLVLLILFSKALIGKHEYKAQMREVQSTANQR